MRTDALSVAKLDSPDLKVGDPVAVALFFSIICWLRQEGFPVTAKEDFR